MLISFGIVFLTNLKNANEINGQKVKSDRLLGAAAQGAGQPEAIDPTEIEDGEAEAENEIYLEDDWEKPDWGTPTT